MLRSPSMFWKSSAVILVRFWVRTYEVSDYH
jgi:hypothetical protein